MNSTNIKEFGKTVRKLPLVFITSIADIMYMCVKNRGKKDCF